MRAVLEALAQAGILGLARREGNRRVYDLAERLFPPALLAERPSEDDQMRHKVLSRYRAHGLLPVRGGQQEIWIGAGRTAAERYHHRDALVADGVLVPVAVEGIRGDRCILGAEVAALDDAAASVAAGEPDVAGVAFLAALDPLVWDRDLLRSLWDFDYVWEVYVPAAKRRWGYYVLPILFGDRFVGRIEPRIERSTATLRVLDVWWEPGFDPVATPGFASDFAAALRAHAAFLGATRVDWPRVARHRALRASIADELEDLLGSRRRAASVKA